MAKDFRANQIRTIKLIGSGGIDNSKPYLGLMIYSSSVATSYDGVNSIDLTKVGDDIWMLVDGAPNTTAYLPEQKPSGGSVLFKGDVVISGTLWAERQIIEVDNTVEGDFFSPHTAVLGFDTFPAGFARALVDPDTPNAGANRDGTVSFNIVAGSAGVWAYSTTINKDVFFHVSGSRDVRGTTDRGLALFDGDVHVSGNLSMGPGATWSTDIILDNDTNDPPVIKHAKQYGDAGEVVFSEYAITDRATNLWHLDIVHSGTAAAPEGADTGLRLRVNQGAASELVRSQFMISGSGDVSIDKGKKFFLSSETGKNVYFRYDDSGTPEVLKLFGPDGVNGGGTFTIENLTVSGSAGFFLPRYTSGPNPGQAKGVMFAGGTTGGADGSPGDAGIYYNRGASFRNPVLLGDNNTFTITASYTPSGPGDAHKLRIGATKVELWGTEQGININASDPARTDSHGGPLQLYATGSGITMWGDVAMKNSLAIDGNLTVYGDYIIGHVITASIQDPVLILNSGSLIANSGGGIAIASGSNYVNQSLVFGRYGTGAPPPEADRDTFFAGRLDVDDGHVLDFSGAEPVRMLAAGYRVGPNIMNIITESAGVLAISGARLAFESNTKIFFSDISGLGALTGGENYIQYNNVSPNSQGLFLSIGTGSFRVASDAATTSKILLGSTGHEWWATPASGIGPTEFFTSQNLIISASGGLVLSASGELVVSASSTTGLMPHPETKIFGGKVIISGTNDSSGQINLLGSKGIFLSASHANAKVTLTAGPSTELVPAQLILSGGGDSSFGMMFVNTPSTEASNIVALYPDINFFVSGSMSSRQSTTRGTSVFGGDLVVSGTAKLGALAVDNLVLEGLSTDEPYVRFGLPTDSPKIYEDDLGNLSFYDDAIVDPGYTLTQLAARGVELNNNVWKVTYAGGGGDYGSYVATSGSVSFDWDQNWAGSPDPYVPKRTNSPGFGGNDVFFVVSGSKGGKSAGHERSTSLFRGDLLTSGAMYWAQISAPLAAAQTVGPNAVAVYAKDVSGQTRLFYRNDVAELPLGSGGSLDDAYDTPDGGGIKSTATGSIINVDGRPVQLDGDPTAATPGTNKTILVVSGAMEFVDFTANSDAPGIWGATANSDLRFGVNNGSITEVFKFTGGSANMGMASGKKIYFQGSESDLYLRGYTAGGQKKIELANTTVGAIHLKVAPTMLEVSGSMLPGTDDTYDLGSGAKRWANVYTGDLHLRNDRGNWTILEERDYLCVVNNITGKKYKMALEPLEDDE